MPKVKLCKTCDGCGACVNACKFKALEMAKNENGFFVATYNEKNCKNCGICERICKQKATTFQFTQNTFIVKAKEEETLMRSSSGGAFTALTDVVLDLGGKIYGAIFGQGFSVEHACAIDKIGRNKMRGSKYVQSNVGDCYKEIKKDLLEGKDVFFSGTPCQVDGLIVFLKTLGVSTEKLVTCEVLCNGVSSPKLWERYVKEFIKLSKISNIYFRYKSSAIKGSIFVVEKKNGFLDARGYYTKLYTSGNCLSESCYQCRYTRKERAADITIGDMQGTFNGTIELNKAFGLSVVMVNTEKGYSLWKKAKAQVAYQDITGQGYEQKRMIAAVQKPSTVETFWQDEKKYSMRKLLKKYAGRTLREEIYQIKTSLEIKKRGKK